MTRRKSLRDQFIVYCRDGHFALQFILDRLGIKPEMLHRWLRQPGFRRALRRAMTTARRRRELEIELGANKGADRLTRISSGHFDRNHPPKDVERLASLNLIYAASAQEQLRICNARKSVRVKPTLAQEPSRDLAHPDLVGGAEALLAELEASR